MNKYGFLSSLLTLMLLLLQFIPLGIYFKPGGKIDSWIALILGLKENPLFNFRESIPISLIHYKNYKVFLWGIITPEKINFWYQIHGLTFLIFFLLGAIDGFITLIGSVKENEMGKKIMNFNFYIILTILLYLLMGIPIYSKSILGTQFNFLDIFFFLNFGFYILLIDMILAIIAKYKHPIK